MKVRVVKGQKGTVGMTYNQEDMPYTKDGITPDIIMNPNAIPKRMTIAQFIECVFGKVGTIAGCEMDATPFRKVTVENISEVMEKMGYKGAGTEVLYNGKTGEQITANIFMGPTFYYRLKHLVEDKQHCIDYNTEILTKSGWKKHDSLNMDDEIATLKDGINLVYEKPSAIHNYPDYEGQIYVIKNKFIDMKTTDNHRMWVWNGKSERGFDFEYASDIVGKPRVFKKDAVWESENKDSENIFDKSTSHAKDFIDGLLLGSRVYYTPSKEKADQFQHACLHAGWSCTIYFDDELYECVIHKNIFDRTWLSEINNYERLLENEKCPVWCVTVPNEVFMIRRNGKCCWTGNSRATGPYQLLTHQPAEGRSRDGGFRFGEMERDAMLSHGSVQFLKERTFDSSDKYYVWVDNETGMISPINPEKGIYKSLYSDNTTKFSKIQIPYSSKLLIQELQSMHINPRMMVKNK